jgi:hypothetical protein
MLAAMMSRKTIILSTRMAFKITNPGPAKDSFNEAIMIEVCIIASESTRFSTTRRLPKDHARILRTRIELRCFPKMLRETAEANGEKRVEAQELTSRTVLTKRLKEREGEKEQTSELYLSVKERAKE